MSMLEEKIRKNKEAFDGAEPSEGHLDRFQKKLSDYHEGESGQQPAGSGRFFRVAAVLTALLALSLTYYLVNPSKSPDRISASILPPEIHEARLYYEKEVDKKLQKIDDCAMSDSEASYIRKMIREEIVMIDSTTINLEQQLQHDQQNTRLINALLRSYKTKSDLLDDIINRLCHI